MSTSIRIAGLAAIIVIALGVLAFVVLRPATPQGTAPVTPQQMRPGVRGGHRSL